MACTTKRQLKKVVIAYSKGFEAEGIMVSEWDRQIEYARVKSNHIPNPHPTRHSSLVRTFSRRFATFPTTAPSTILSRMASGGEIGKTMKQGDP